MHAIMTSAEVWMMLPIRLSEVMDTQMPQDTFLNTSTPSKGFAISITVSLAHTPLFDNHARESNKPVDDVDYRCAVASDKRRYQSLHISIFFYHARL